ncbi:hypothetical protein ES703_111231 [subsurface metagenome]
MAAATDTRIAAASRDGITHFLGNLETKLVILFIPDLARVENLVVKVLACRRLLLSQRARPSVK